MGRHGKAGRSRFDHPVALTSVLALGLAGAIAGASTLTSQATASSRKASAHASAAPSASPSVSATVTASPSATPTAAPTASPSATPTSSPSAAPTTAPTTASPSPSPAETPGTTAVAPANADSARIGALFSGSASAGNHFCTASVIDSPTKNLVLTAAHCISSTDGVTFVPGYRDGKTPYGVWQVTKIYTADNWSQNSDPDEDFAILQVAPSNGHTIEDVVGGNALGLNASFSAQVHLYGYPGNTEEPILCTNTTSRQDTYQRRIDCPSYSNGTSGGPWIDSDNGKVIGVIGGYQQGGDTDDTSYSAYFDHTIGDLYSKAVAGSA